MGQPGAVKHGPSLFSDQDIYLFKEGAHFRAYEKLGAHPMAVEGDEGIYFAIWAPNAERISVFGDFNGWNPHAHPLALRWDTSGIWEGFVPGIEQGVLYKYHIVSKYNNYTVDKGDPFAFLWEISPKTASVVWELNYDWSDERWMKGRDHCNTLNSPFSIYEVHFGSWRRITEENNRFLTYREMAYHLVTYLKEMGFTHVEFLPIMEHPFYGSWGYQAAGYFAPSSRFGTPQDFMHLIDSLHQNGIGVILDWVPSHFPTDEHGLAFFDGTPLYEHPDYRKGFHPDWKSYIFNYARNEVRNFLISNALFWLDKYHVDCLRVDAVASMLYLDYSRKEGQWVPNEYGGRENIEAISFIKRFNQVVYTNFPDVQTIAEESTAWPQVTRPPHEGGLGFGMKWNMGWMHDILDYLSKDPIYRKYYQDRLTFSLWYAFSENFTLSLSHDEVVYGKKSLIEKMPGDDAQKFANLRLLFGYMYVHPGKKLLFMGDEFGQRQEWNHEQSLEWRLLEYEAHRGVRRWVQDLNRFYRVEPALFECDFESQGFEWIQCQDAEKSIISFLRKGKAKKDILLIICNFTPVARADYRIGLPSGGFWKEVLNSDAKEYGGSGYGNLGGLEATPIPHQGEYNSLLLHLPPLGILIFKKQVTKAII